MVNLKTHTNVFLFIIKILSVCDTELVVVHSGVDGSIILQVLNGNSELLVGHVPLAVGPNVSSVGKSVPFRLLSHQVKNYLLVLRIVVFIAVLLNE